MDARSRNHARCLLIWASLTALVSVAQVLALDALFSTSDALQRGGLGAQRFDQLLVGWCAMLMVGCGAWSWAAGSLVVLDAARGRIGSRPLGCPAVLRRGLLLACGVAVVGSVGTTGAYAGPVPDAPRGHPAAEAESRLASDLARRAITGLPLPERVGIGEGLAHPHPHPHPRPRPTPSGTKLPAAADPRLGTTEPSAEQFVVVRPGDSLWKIAVQALGEDTHPASIESWWRDLYELNRPVIGPDPDLIHPGLRLRLPGVGQE